MRLQHVPFLIQKSDEHDAEGLFGSCQHTLDKPEDRQERLIILPVSAADRTRFLELLHECTDIHLDRFGAVKFCLLRRKRAAVETEVVLSFFLNDIESTVGLIIESIHVIAVLRCQSDTDRHGRDPVRYDPELFVDRQLEGLQPL